LEEEEQMTVDAVLIILNRFAGQEAILISAEESLKCLALVSNSSLEKKLGNFLESAALERQLAEEPAGGESEGQYENIIEVMKHFSLIDAKSLLALKGRSITPLTSPYSLVIFECVF
jgi:hypothetical protein